MGRIISDLVGTLQNTFRLGTARIKNATNVIQARNAADTANIPLTASVIAALAADGKRGGFKVAEGMSADTDYELPAADGSTGQGLVTNGSKVLSWSTLATGENAVKEQIETITWKTVSPVTIFTPPANARINKIIVDVETAFDGAASALSVGVSGAPARYMGTTENALDAIAIYEVEPLFEEDGTPDEIIVTFAIGAGATVGSCRVSVTYSNPS